MKLFHVLALVAVGFLAGVVHAEGPPVCPWCNRRHDQPWCRRPVNRLNPFFTSAN